MRTYLLMLLALFLASLGALAILRPGADVRLEAEVLRLGAEDGLELLDRRRADLEFTVNLELLHARLSLAAGRFDQAEDYYQAVLARVETSPADILDELARTALLAGEEERATSYLSLAFAVDPDEARRRTLAARYRGLGETDREADVLLSVAVAELRPEERDRLASLMVAAQDVAGYERVLTESAALDDAHAKTPRTALLSLLLEFGRGEDALDTARQWLTDAADPAALCAEVISTFLRRGAQGEAAALAFGAIERDPDLGAHLPSIFAASGYGILARAVQAEWLDADVDIAPEDWDAAVEFAAVSGDLTGLHLLLGRYPGADVPAEAFMVMLRYRGVTALVPYRAHLDDAMIAERPLLGAALATWSGRRETTFAHLTDAAQRSLSAWDREIWRSLARSLDGSVWQVALATDGSLGAEYRVMAAGEVRGPAEPISSDRVGEGDRDG